MVEEQVITKCDCDDCAQDDDTACSFNCEKGEDECLGCRTAREYHEEIDYECARAQGRL